MIWGDSVPFERFKLIGGWQAICVLGCLAGPTSGLAECKNPVAHESLNDFIDRPARYMERFSSDDDGLSESIRRFAAINRDGLKAIRFAVRTASARQKRAIGAGMEQAVVACLPRDGEIAKQIAETVTSVEDSDVTAGYIAALDEGGVSKGAVPKVNVPYHRSSTVHVGEGLDLSSTAVPKLVPDLK